ncbi:response regulator [Pseudooceanicola sp. CBS1P-1]|nr:response regulator [Pseudooceanicola albus]MBT9384974.1 response regulator [Pseudooceanicola endophyticus]
MQPLLIAAAVLCILTIPALNFLVSNRFSEAQIAANQLPTALQQLERNIGYSGFIHNFKNAILRPAEPRYYDLAIEDYESAMVELRTIDRLVEALDRPLDISALENTLEQYRRNIDVARTAAAGGASIPEVDALVRVDDAPARRDLDAIHDQAQAALDDWLRRDRLIARLQILGLTLLLLTIAAVVILILIGTGKARRDRLREAGELKDRINALSQLTAGIAHDVNNLLATIYYAVELALDDKIPDTSARFLESGRRAILRGQALTGRLLAFARPQPGQARSLSVQALFSAAEARLAPDLASGVTLHLAEDPAGLTLFCDQTQMEEALFSLLQNANEAIQRSGKGGRITLTARKSPGLQAFMRTDRDTTRPALGMAMTPSAAKSPVKGLVELIVEDDGPGMSANIRRRAFEPFYTSKADHAGSGLGLAITYGYVQSTGGDMKITSRPGAGTAVHMLLPQGGKIRPAEDTPPEEAFPPEDSSPSHKGNRVLLVEDEATLRDLMRISLENSGYLVRVADDGASALSQLRAGVEFDLLVTDIVMPGPIDGFRLAEHVARMRPGVPILYQTGNTGPDLAARMVVQAPILLKPCSPEDLETAIRTALDLAAQRRADAQD